MKSFIKRFILDNISYKLYSDIEQITLKKRNIKQYLTEKVLENYNHKRKTLNNDDCFFDFVRVATLTAVDTEWVEEVDYLQQLPSAVAGRGSAQRNPVFEYQNDAMESYNKMEKSVYKNILRNILLSSINIDENGKLLIVFP